MSEPKSIMITGVGGQGTLLASRIIGNLLIQKGFDVKVSEVHGMSQRGGSVVTYVRWGTKVYSPIIEKGEADVILAFEQLEAARWLEYLKPGGVMVVNTQKIPPMPVIMGKSQYPLNIMETIKGLDVEIVSVPARELAEKAGLPNAVNVVLIGVAAKYLGFDRPLIEQAIRDVVPQKFVEMNLKALEFGYEIKR